MTNVPADAERWEKVIRKLRAKSMPPPGLPRPDAATYDALAGYLETELDRAAAAKPNAGKLPLLHRLSRTEYQNAVRDLLALDALPKEMEYSMLLPPDNANSGFDNHRGSAVCLAHGDGKLPGRSGENQPPGGGRSVRSGDGQHLPHARRAAADVRVDGLPFGTRGGLAVRSYFPADGEYRIKVTFVGRSEEPQQLEITVDGERVQLA